MLELYFTPECTLSEADRWSAIWKFICNNKTVQVQFRKKSGEIRTMVCTLDPTLMPAVDANLFRKTRVIDYRNITVWCIEKAAWRKFITLNTISLETVTHTTTVS